MHRPDRPFWNQKIVGRNLSLKAELNFSYNSMDVFLAAVFAGAQLYETEVEYNLVTSSSPDLFSCCPVETTISIYPQTPNQMLQTDQHFSILRDYYDG